MPDQSTFSKARHGRVREAEVFRRVFERVVGACRAAGLVGGEGFAIEASVLEADASYALRVDGPTLPPERADPASATRPVREYLAALDEAAARVAGLSGEVEGQDQPERLAAEPAPAKSLSLTDPAAAWTSKGARKASFAYAVNTLVDLKRAIVVDVAASPARWTEEVATTAVMIERTRQRFGPQPSRLAADAAYGSGRLVGWLMARGIAPPCAGASPQVADQGHDDPLGVPLRPRAGRVRLPHRPRPEDHGRGDPRRAQAGQGQAHVLRSVRAQAAARTGGLARMVTRNVHEDEREHVRSLAGTPTFKRSARGRRKVEMLFAHLKRHLGLRRLRLRRPDRGRRRVPARRHRPNPATARPELGRAALDERPGPDLSGRGRHDQAPPADQRAIPPPRKPGQGRPTKPPARSARSSSTEFVKYAQAIRARLIIGMACADLVCAEELSWPGKSEQGR